MMWIDDRPSIPCGLCGTPTPMTGTKRCNRCWELESRIYSDPALAQKILDDMKQQDGGKVWNRERIEAVASRVERAGDKEAADLIRDLLEAGIEAEQERIDTAPPSAPVEVKTLSEFMAEQEALHPGIHDKVQAAADELRASLAQQPAAVDLPPLPERFNYTNSSAHWCYNRYTMTRNDLGAYVLAKDYDALRSAAEALRAEVERLQEIVRPKREDECLTLDHWRMRAYALEENWSRCSRACAVEQTKREQAEARAKRLAEELREAKEKMLAQVKWVACDCGCEGEKPADAVSIAWLRASTMLRDQEEGQ